MLAIRMCITCVAARKTPRIGDRKMIDGVEHVLVHKRVKFGPHWGAHVFSSGRPRYEWVPAPTAEPTTKKEAS